MKNCSNRYCKRCCKHAGECDKHYKHAQSGPGKAHRERRNEAKTVSKPEEISSIQVHVYPHDNIKEQARKENTNSNYPHLRAEPLLEKWKTEVLERTNAERARHGVGPLTLHSCLNLCAKRHNADMALVRGKISHIGSDGSRLGMRLVAAGYCYSWAGENVAQGQKNPEHVIRSLMKSKGHRRNILRGDAIHLGVHVGRDEAGRFFWTQLLGSPTKYPNNWKES